MERIAHLRTIVRSFLQNFSTCIYRVQSRNIEQSSIGKIDIDFLILAWNIRDWPRKFNGLEIPWIINIAKKRSLRRETSSCVELHSRFISQERKGEGGSCSNVIFQLFRSRSIIDYIAYSWHDLLPAVYGSIRIFNFENSRFCIIVVANT